MPTDELRDRKRVVLGSIVAFAMALGCAAPDSARNAARGDPGGAEAVALELYDRRTFEAGSTPDWDAVRALFDAEAVVVLRAGREQRTVFTLEGRVQDFVDFLAHYDVVRTGRTERLVELDGFA